jgi:hypothetical protein
MTKHRSRIGIILGSTRQGRFGDRPANWILEIACWARSLRAARDVHVRVEAA